ncbi:MAG: F0F1 ATP synthase subunit B [Rhodospirillales bacterium]|nr:F0F1 ATP synthase subunit B [Rhodospirillales bacterium]
MEAWAAETAAGGAHATAHAEPFYGAAEFWVAIGLAIFLFFVARHAVRLISVALDERAERIRNRLDEASRLAEEAQTLLAAYERKQRDAAEEADAILASARREAERLAAEAKDELEQTLKRREVQAMERIAQAQQAAIAEVRGRAVDIAIEATRTLLGERLTPAQGQALIDAAISELPSKLH